MEVLNKGSIGLCQVCDKNPIMGLGFGGKWVCGLCLLALEKKLNEQKAVFYSEIEKEIRESG